MSSRSADLINLALLKSFPSTCKKAKLSTIDDCIAASARKVLSTKIEYIHCPQYSTDEFLKTLKTKYTVLKPKLKNKKKKKKKKLNNGENSNSTRLPMKNTELCGQNLSLPSAKFVLFAPDDVQLGWKSSIPVGSGFVNLGTTCYINSTLQALFHVPSFVNWLNNDKKHEVHCEKMNGMLHSECIVCAIRKTLFLSHRASGSIRPKYIIEKIKTICKHLSPFRQEDAHEFLRYLMEAMEKSYITALGIATKKLDSYSKETTPLNQIFGGYIRTEVTCLECSHISTTFQHFQDLILDIRQNNTTTVYDGLESYFSKERLDGDEAYHCEHCKKKVSAYKKFSIERAPNVLCIQLKRFNINSYYGGSKISKQITTPQTIDLSKFKHKKGTSNFKPLKYRLVSMVFHHGPSANSGHYTALGCTSSGSYYYFNDEHVFPVHLGNYTNNPNAYIMFYEREEGSLINENKTNMIKSAVSNSAAIPLTNGNVNGPTQPRTNGFFAKRECPYPASSSHPKFIAVSKKPNATASKDTDTQRPASYRLQSWEPVANTTENESKPSQSQQPQPIKSVVVVPTVPCSKVKSTSLVPYTPSSDSESSDVEPEKSAADSNNNSSKSTTLDDKITTLSPLAKKNSTLTSLLISSPKNENPAFRVTPSPRPLTNGKMLKSDEKVPTELQNGNGDIKSPEERGMISFSLFNRDKKKFEPQLTNRENEAKTNGSTSSYGTKSISENTKENGDDGENDLLRNVGGNDLCGYGKKLDGIREEMEMNRAKASTSYLHTPRENGLVNGAVKTNGVVNGMNGDRTKATNGWIVTEMEDECNTSGLDNSKNNGDWVVTDKENRKLPMKDSSRLKDSRKWNGNSNGNDGNIEIRGDNCSSQKDAYSSQNGYGGKVISWNGDLSSINRESEQERKEQNKRKYSYDDDIDRGKVKKPKYYNRNENGSCSQPQSPRKNPIQQHHNQYNQSNGNGKNNMNNNRGRKWQFTQNGFHFNNNNSNGNNRRPPHNGHFRHNSNNYYNNHHHHHHRNNYTHQNNWRR